MTRSALFIFALLRSTPMASISSAPSRIPAVSMSLKRMPPIFSTSSIVSLVVPAMALTMALFSLSRALSKVDLPAFGLPIIATLTPCLITLPKSKETNKSWVVLSNFPSNSRSLLRSANSTSSWEKSSSNSIKAENWISSSRIAVSTCEKPPRT